MIAEHLMWIITRRPLVGLAALTLCLALELPVYRDHTSSVQLVRATGRLSWSFVIHLKGQAVLQGWENQDI